MVRLGMPTIPSGQRSDERRVYSQPQSNQHYSHPLEQVLISEPSRDSSHYYDAEDYSGQTSSGNHFPSGQIHDETPSSHSLLTVLTSGHQTSQLNPPGWLERPSRSSSDGHHRSQKYQCQEKVEFSSEDPSDTKYPREVKWCPVCRDPILTSVVHVCSDVLEPEHNVIVQRSISTVSSYQGVINTRDSYAPSHISSISSPPGEDSNFHNVSELNDNTPVLSRVPSLLPITKNAPPHSATPLEGTRQGVVIANPSLLKHSAPPPPATHPSSDGHLYPEHQASLVQRVSPSGKPCHSAPPWSVKDKKPSGQENCEWETPTSLISRLTAGMTAHSSQQQQPEDKALSNHSCTSPSMSESSDVSSSFFQKDSAQTEDLFHMAHQELVDETSKRDPHSKKKHAPHVKIKREKCIPPNTGNKRSRRYTSSESVSSEPVHSESSLCGSQDSDAEDNSSCSSRYLDRNGQLPDLDTLLKTIKQPILTPHVPDESNIHDFLEPHEIGHINHMIKSLSDAVLTISLPDTLYKNKGFTPLDYMDIHLNAVIRQFFFVFKNEDFLNLVLSDQIALLNGCSLRAVCCAGLYLFNKDSGCWYIPGSTSRVNHPVVHVSDLLQVYPQYLVNRLYELNTAAAELGFDWPIGVITNCILMYTPIKKLIQEIDKIDILRNKYVNLLLKYISWKHGHHNASLIFPEMLKVLDALLLLVEDLSTITLNLSEDEVVAVEERLSTLTLIQMAPLKCHSDKFKETIATWSALDYVKLEDIQNRLCMALQFSMLDSMQSSTAEYWTRNGMYYASGLQRDNHSLTHQKNIPRIMPASEKSSRKGHAFNRILCADHKSSQPCNELTKIGSFLSEKDLVLLRRFLEDVTVRESSLLVKHIKEKMDSKQIQLIIKKLCS
nr:uncharacterized protein LOC123762341 [Procambarus clarkii]XP_045604776.1 uncharacterized protein LOC123762341 [Procambarus clarkii]XP_045604777.1 uncharacterized protein LOC123762341 [Procambarus clarkii]XP_045604779.1 uncharacterized protein LOC123762341 [Procambarus clarkii]